MVIGILQPGYLPWLGFFEQFSRSDVFVLYDDVQYDKHSWRNRNRIKTANGVQWLTVPVLVNFEEHPPITEVRIDKTSRWRKKHLLSIRQSYSRAPFFADYIGIFDDAFSHDWDCLVDLDTHLIARLVDALGMAAKPIIRSSSLGICGDRVERLIRICKHFNADVFYEGTSGAEYINPADFKEHGIDVVFQNYRHPVYAQLYGDFVPYLSVIDLLFNCGDKSLEILVGKHSSGA